jgi:hypothetical protein
MTEAAIPVTQATVERFVEAYLTTLGADIWKDGRRWTVSLPPEAETDLDLDGATLVVTNDPGDVEEDTIALSPESEFVERLLDEAAERCPVGSLALTDEAVDIRLPPWLEASSVEVRRQSFTPYYDRRALCVLFHAGIETVSEYQSEELRAVAIDLNGYESRPRLAQTYLDIAEVGAEGINAGPSPESDVVANALEAARDIAEEDISPTVEDIRERATRAAGVELDEYREYAQQRCDELDAEIERHNERIEEATEKIEAAAEQDERVEALRQRKELRSERDDLRSERDDLRAEMEAGFPKRRREIRERHALTVRLKPVAFAAVSYERGELAVTLEADGETVNASYPYAVGVGVTDDQHCDGCGGALSEENPLAIAGTQLVGATCSD